MDYKKYTSGISRPPSKELPSHRMVACLPSHAVPVTIIKPAFNYIVQKTSAGQSIPTHSTYISSAISNRESRAGNAGDGAVLTGSTSSSVTESTLTSDPPDLLHRDGIGRVRSVGLIVDLCFSGDSNTLYYACRLANTRTPRVRVIMWSMESRYLINDCIIKDEVSLVSHLDLPFNVAILTIQRTPHTQTSS